MRSFFEVWRRHLWLWVLPLGFCVLNLLAYSLYRSAFAGKVEDLERLYQQTTDQLAAIGNERQLIEQFLARVESHQAQVKGLYGNHFQTEPERFTRVIQEIKSLAEKAGLEPTTLSYPMSVFGDYGVVQRSIRFSVAGSYEQLRNLINFLELTDHFIALRGVGLGDSNGRNLLAITLDLSTFFSSRKVSTLEAASREAVPPGAAAGDLPGEEPST